MPSLTPADLTLLVLMVVASITDATRHKIYNWTTYPGMLAGIVLRFATDGTPGLIDAVEGFLLCGFLMVLCFVLFNSEIGGGDVKLITMMGAFLGIERGVEAMLWTFIIGGVFGVGYLIWKHGLLHLVGKAIEHAKLIVRTGKLAPLTEQERQPLKRWLFLAPSGLAAVCLVLADHHWGLFSGR